MRSLTLCLFFFLLEERTGVSDSALFMFLLGNKRWLRVACVFPCVGFLKKREEEKKKTPPLPFPSPSALSLLPTPSLSFCLVLFCYESTFLFRNPWFAGFVFSVKSSLRQLGCPPPSSPARNGVGGAWPAPFHHPLPTPTPQLPPPPGAAWARAQPAHLLRSERAPPRCTQSAVLQVAPRLWDSGLAYTTLLANSLGKEGVETGGKKCTHAFLAFGGGRGGGAWFSGVHSPTRSHPYRKVLSSMSVFKVL